MLGFKRERERESVEQVCEEERRKDRCMLFHGFLELGT